MSRYFDPDAAVDRRHRNVHVPTGRREFDRICEQIPDHLLQAGGIAGHNIRLDANIVHQLHTLVVGTQSDRINGIPHDLAQVDAADRQPGPTRHQLTGVHQVVNQLAKGVAVADDPGNRLVAAIGGNRLLFEHAGPSDNGIRRGSEWQ